MDQNGFCLPPSKDEMQCLGGFLDNLTDAQAKVMLNILSSQEF